MEVDMMPAPAPVENKRKRLSSTAPSEGGKKQRLSSTRKIQVPVHR